ncbi:bifunctional methylenetetrahydrofolate dehydrogenase/methenyltetrahydrofolate cyclohydrolase [bacterium]|nr:bifunctional methylenetetrahydrofolate dehydrogenase/methenyltetrahydrofolate cyclohydrolase [bacterium]
MQILDGKKVADEFAAKLKLRVARLKKRGIVPKLVVIMIEPQKRSLIYVRMKHRRAEELGIEIEEITLKQQSQTDYAAQIHSVAARPNIHGIILQLPIPDSLDKQALIDCIPPHKDVDGLTTANRERFESGKPDFWPATPRGVLKIMRDYHINPADKTVTVIGRSDLVGYPLACLLKRKGAHVHIAHRGTPDIAALTRESDIIVSAAGSPRLVTADMVRKGAAIIDVGINEDGERIVGDVDYNMVKDKASYITPVPGGVGPTTVIMLMSNVIKAARRQSAD